MLVRAVLVANLCWWLTPPVVAGGPKDYLKKPDAWFATPEATRVAENILTYQTELGGWPKNTDTTSQPFIGDIRQLRANFDNSATTDELRFLARLDAVKKTDVYRKAFLQGYDYILKAQYPNGGWPQYAPPPANAYPRYITFNDDAMTRLLEFLRETYTLPQYQFIDEARRARAKQAFNRGIDCILQCQIKVDGQLTAWCAQHDEKTFAPRPARSYELESISGGESVHIVQLLMSLDHPSPEVIQAVEGAVAWFQKVKLTGIRIDIVKDEKSPKGTNKIIVQDAGAPPLWARFYQIGTNRPMFVDRDGIIHWNLADIGYERRNGYSWLSGRAQKLLEKEYPAWKKKINRKA